MEQKELIKTEEFARQWIESGKPCVYRYGWRWKGALCKPITKEKALELLPKYKFGMGFKELGFLKEDLKDGMGSQYVLEFNELSENDMY
jgi:hypothetical protein|nr:MAG TPA: hypothetical protein [Caudoviricetes sp.]